MRRLPLLLLIVAMLGVGWLLVETLTGQGADGASSMADLDDDGGDLLGGEREGADGTAEDDVGPLLATSGTPRSERNAKGTAGGEAFSQALGVGPPSATVHLVGSVKDPAGRAAGGIDITAIGPNGTVRFKTDADGRFEQTLAAGRYDLLLRGEEGALLRRNFRVDGSLTEAIELTLRETSALIVSVLRGDEPVSGVTLEMVPDGQFAETLKTSVVTGADGQARFDDMLRARYDLTGDVPEGPQLVRRVSLSKSETELKIPLPSGVQFSGTVRIGADGPAVPNARLELRVRPNKSPADLLVEFGTEADGTFDVFVPRGRPRSLVVTADGFAPFPSRAKHNGVLRALRRLRNDKPVKYDVQLDAGLSWSGRLLDTEGEPVPEVVLGLRLARSRDLLAKATTTADGNFIFPHLAPERYVISLVTPGVFPAAGEPLAFRIVKEPIVRDLRVLVARRISGRVVTTTGEGVPAARVWIVGGGLAMRGARDAGRLVEAYTSQNGSFLLSDIPTDRNLSVRASMGDREAVPVRVAAHDAKPSAVRLILSPTGEITGTAMDLETRKPLARVRVDVRPEPWDGRTRKRVLTRGDGTYRVAGLIPGSWVVTPQLTGYLKHEGETLDIGATGLEANLMLDPGVVFQGVTLREDGKPLPRVTVTVRRVQDGKLTGRWSARSDGQGRFRVSGVVRNAEYRLYATRGGWVTVTRNGLRDGQSGMRVTMRRRGRR